MYCNTNNILQLVVAVIMTNSATALFVVIQFMYNKSHEKISAESSSCIKLVKLTVDVQKGANQKHYGPD